MLSISQFAKAAPLSQKKKKKLKKIHRVVCACQVSPRDVLACPTVTCRKEMESLSQQRTPWDGKATAVVSWQGVDISWPGSTHTPHPTQV